jgi:hypothetical protein
LLRVKRKRVTEEKKKQTGREREREKETDRVVKVVKRRLRFRQARKFRPSSDVYVSRSLPQFGLSPCKGEGVMEERWTQLRNPVEHIKQKKNRTTPEIKWTDNGGWNGGRRTSVDLRSCNRGHFN